MKYNDVYKDIVDMLCDLHFVNEDRIKKSKNILLYIVNLSDAEDFNLNSFVLKFLNISNELFSSLLLCVANNFSIRKFAIEINRYTQINEGCDISTFVNNIYDENVPAQWEELCRLAGIDTSNWNVAV